MVLNSSPNLFEIKTLQLKTIANYIYVKNNPHDITLLESILDQFPCASNYVIETGVDSRIGLVSRVHGLYEGGFSRSAVTLRLHINLLRLNSSCKLKLNNHQVQVLESLLY